MKKILPIVACLVLAGCAYLNFHESTQTVPFEHPSSVILMIGDGMGANHLKCAADTKPIYITTLPVKGWVHTRSANNEITDSAAAATAYSCGQKTNNRMLGKLPNGDDCQTIAEKAVQEGLSVGIYSTDHSTGATPSAFYVHTNSRKDKATIKSHKKQAKKTMDINVPVSKISEKMFSKLNKLGENKKGFFAMFEGAKIDTLSQKNQLDKMKEELYDFDLAVVYATDFVHKNPNTTLIVLADHETGGLTNKCQYTTKAHTGVDIPVYAYGKYAKLFEGKQDNTEIYHKMYQILFEE